MAPPRIESGKHLEAFEYYFSLGDKRSHDTVADHFKISKRAVHEWSRTWNWTKRVVDREHRVAAKVAAKIEEDVAKRKKQIASLAVSGMAIWGENAQNKKVRADSAKDLKDLTQTYLLVTDQPTDNVKHSGEVGMVHSESAENLWARAKALGPEMEKKLQDAFAGLLDVKRAIDELDGNGG